MPQAVGSMDSETAVNSKTWSVASIVESRSSRALLFESHGVRFAVTTESVTEVVEAPQFEPVAGSPDWYCGIAIYKRKPAALIDAAQFFTDSRLSPDQNTDHTRHAIVVNLASSTYLLLADRILNLSSLDSLATSADLSLAEHTAIKSVYEVQNHPVALINLPELLRQTRLLRECV